MKVLKILFSSFGTFAGLLGLKWCWARREDPELPHAILRRATSMWSWLNYLSFVSTIFEMVYKIGEGCKQVGGVI